MNTVTSTSTPPLAHFPSEVEIGGHTIHVNWIGWFSSSAPSGASGYAVIGPNGLRRVDLDHQAIQKDAREWGIPWEEVALYVLLHELGHFWDFRHLTWEEMWERWGIAELAREERAWEYAPTVCEALGLGEIIEEHFEAVRERCLDTYRT